MIRRVKGISFGLTCVIVDFKRVHVVEQTARQCMSDLAQLLETAGVALCFSEMREAGKGVHALNNSDALATLHGLNVFSTTDAALAAA